jgi:hypothetical protein
VKELFNSKRVAAFSKYINGATADSCWIWTGYVNKQGYGCFSIKHGDSVFSRNAHRLAYAMFWGEPPKHLCIDHTCRTRACVNPYHLRAITNRTNILIGECNAAKNSRKTHCVNGHPLEGDNVLLVRGTDRSCRMCAKIRKQEWKRRTAVKHG